MAARQATTSEVAQKSARTIEATSRGENKGTTVTIRLPVPANVEQLESISSE